MMLPDYRVRQRDYLLDIARALAEELNLDKLLERILHVAIEMLAGQAGFIALRSEQNGWKVQVWSGLPKPLVQYIEPYFNQIPDLEEHPIHVELTQINRLIQELANSGSFGLLNGVGLPLVAREQTIGVIYIFRSYSASFSLNDRTVLSSFANQAAIAVQNAQFYNQIIQEKQRMSALLDSAADGIMILTPALKVERVNPAFVRLFQNSENDIINQDHQKVIRWSNPPAGITLEDAVAGGWPLTAHAHLYVEGDLLTNPQKPKIPVGITYAPLISPEGTLLNIVATLRDITRFRQADELKSTFISIISHELKTPVALIKGYVSTLRREDARWDRSIVDESLTVIEDEADRLGLLIENMLDASRLQAGGLALKQTDLSLPDLANRLAKRFATQTSMHQIIVNFPEDFPIVLADEVRIEQVVSNLISNAIKYSNQGEIRISGQVRQDIVIVCVSDQGAGIAPEDIPHVFDRFYRAPDMARNTKGAGLGLFLTRSIIEAHKGHIWVDTESGKGARICFSLPRLHEIKSA
ncbi:MAG: ATP-binding protein [Anaerolineaceae bacterium]